GTYLENDVSILEDPRRRKEGHAEEEGKRRGVKEEGTKCANNTIYGNVGVSVKPSTYARRKKSPIKEKEKSPKEEVLEKEEPPTQEESPRKESPTEEEEKEESPILESP
ncbi:hypothetical protein KI387_040430, partial [Taxus chinensis]